jgi:holin-like protein
MVQAFAVLLVCQLMGEGIVHVTGAPVPGPVIGLVLLAAGLTWRQRHGGGPPLRETPLGQVAGGLLGHLSLLFVPAAVGIVQQGGVLAANGLSIVVALVVSTVLTLAVTAAVFVWAARRFAREERA